MLVREMMTVNPATIDPSATLRDAVAVMRSERQSRLVVCDGNEIVGILVDSDVLRADDLDARVRDVMSTDFQKVCGRHHARPGISWSTMTSAAFP